VVQPGFGALTDRYRNLGWLVAAGLLVAGLGIGLSGLGDNYLITWLAVAASGVGVAAYHPEATRTARSACWRTRMGCRSRWARSRSSPRPPAPSPFCCETLGDAQGSRARAAAGPDHELRGKDDPAMLASRS
jgi:hypothetical protein